MSIGVSVRTRKLTARNNGIGVDRKTARNPQLHIIPNVMANCKTTANH